MVVLRYMDVGFPSCPTAAWQMHSSVHCVVIQQQFSESWKSGTSIHSIKETSLRSSVISSQKAIANIAHQL